MGSIFMGAKCKQEFKGYSMNILMVLKLCNRDVYLRVDKYPEGVYYTA